jgi:hypothetical protein
MLFPTQDLLNKDVAVFTDIETIREEIEFCLDCVKFNVLIDI